MTPVHSDVLKPFAHLEVYVFALVEAETELDPHAPAFRVLGGLFDHDGGQPDQLVRVLHEHCAGAGLEDLAYRAAGVEIEVAVAHAHELFHGLHEKFGLGAEELKDHGVVFGTGGEQTPCAGVFVGQPLDRDHFRTADAAAMPFGKKSEGEVRVARQRCEPGRIRVYGEITHGGGIIGRKRRSQKKIGRGQARPSHNTRVIPWLPPA